MTTALTTAPLLGEPLPVELMNTVWADRDGVHEALDSAAATGAWLQAVRDRFDTSWALTNRDIELGSLPENLRALRDAARALAARQTDDGRETAKSPTSAADAIAIVNRLAGSAPAFPVLEWPTTKPPTLSMAAQQTPAATVLSELARGIVRFFGSADRELLRACQAPGCVLYFVKQHPRREWCSAACGNRARVARHYQRHHG